jgi:autotransporter-associated beta strand protein
VFDLVISASSGLIHGSWTNAAGGVWSGTGNWSGGVPGTGQDTAVFATALSGTAAVTLDGSRSLASLGFNTSGTTGYTISPTGGSTLTLANTATGTATISNSGDNTIAAPVVLGSNLSVTASTGGVLTIAETISDSGGTSNSLSVSGGGELILSGTDTYKGGTTVSGGTLAVTAASALSSSGLVTISAGGRLVLGSGSGIGALLTASSPISSGEVALSAAGSGPATIEGTLGNMATLGGAPVSLARCRRRRRRRFLEDCKRRSKTVARGGACVTVEKRGALDLTRVGVSKACNGITATNLTPPRGSRECTRTWNCGAKCVAGC